MYLVQEVEISDGVKDRRLLAEDSSLTGEGDLSLTNVDFTDDGRYVCQMTNELGSFEQPVDLRVLGTRQTDEAHHDLAIICRVRVSAAGGSPYYTANTAVTFGVVFQPIFPEPLHVRSTTPAVFQKTIFGDSCCRIFLGMVPSCNQKRQRQITEGNRCYLQTISTQRQHKGSL